MSREAPQPSQITVPKKTETFEPGEISNLAEFGGTFRVLDQSGKFRIAPPYRSFRWYDSLSSGEKIDFKAVRRDITNLVGVDTLLQASSILSGDKEQLDKLSVEINRRFADEFGMEGSDTEIERTLKEWAILADSARDRVEKEIGAPEGILEQSNEVRSANSLTSLLKHLLTSTDPRIRFEAGLKLEEIRLEAIDARNEKDQTQARLVEKQIELIREGKDPSEAKPGNEGTFADLQAFMDTYVYKTEKASGKPTVLETEHSKDDYSCTSVTKVPEKQVDYKLYKKPKKWKRITAIKERSFTYHGKTISVYSNERIKDPVSALLKMYRKGSEDPEGDVQDRIGIMAVLETQEEIDAFLEMIERGAKEAKMSYKIQGTEDTLTTRSEFSAREAGSSKKFRTLKFLARIGDMKVEFLIFDHKAYIDNLYQDGVSHVEKQVKMLVESGVAEHFFPQSVYGLDHKKHYVFVVNELRKKMRQGVRLN